MVMKKFFPHKYLKFDILDKNQKIKYEDIEGQFNESYIKFETTDTLLFESGDIIVKKYTNDTLKQNYEVLEWDFIEKFKTFPAHYKVSIRSLESCPTISKVEITNTSTLASNFSKAFGVDENIINKLLVHQTEIKKLFEEFNFLTADSLVVAKEALITARNKDNKIDIEKILNILNTLLNIFS